MTSRRRLRQQRLGFRQVPSSLCLCCIAICACMQPSCIYCISDIFLYLAYIAYCLYIGIILHIIYILHLIHILHILFIYCICCIYMYILPTLLLCPAAGAREMLRRRQRGRRRCGSCLPAARWGGPVGRSGRRPGFAIPARTRMSLPAITSAHEPVVVGLAGMVQEQP